MDFLYLLIGAVVGAAILAVRGSPTLSRCVHSVTQVWILWTLAVVLAIAGLVWHKVTTRGEDPWLLGLVDSPPAFIAYFLLPPTTALLLYRGYVKWRLSRRQRGPMMANSD